MTKHFLWPALALTSALASTSVAQELVLDLNQNTPANPSSSAYGTTATGGAVYFSATDGTQGREPWITDGTAAGTRLLRDLNHGIGNSDPRGFMTLPSGTTLFSADAAEGRELWSTNGTTAGTKLVRDLNPGSADSIVTDPVLFNGEAWFFADDGVNGVELWKSDGTSAGTVLAHEFFPGAVGGMSTTFPGRMSVAGSNLFLFAKNPSQSGWGLYVTDGSPGATQYLTAVTASGFDEIEGFADLNGTLFFGAPSPTLGNEVWVSDGTVAGTFVIDIDPASEANPGDFMTFGNHVYFAATHPTIGRELVRSDGTAAGTTLVRDIEPSSFPLFSSSSPDLLGVANGKLLLAATTMSNGRSLWTTDGTYGGTTLVTTAVSFGFYEITAVPLGTSLVFSASSGTLANELWITDGTAAGTQQATDVAPGPSPSYPSALVAFGNLIVFSADDGVLGNEPWASDGTIAGTYSLGDLAQPFTNFGSEPQGFVEVGEQVFFTANDGINGRELYVTDGTASGTSQVALIGSGTDDFSVVTGIEFDGRLFFMAIDDTNGLEPWMSDGTSAGTFLLKDINPGVGGSNWGLPEHAIIGERMFFTGLDTEHGFELFVTDGTTAGTGLALDFTPGISSGLPSNLKAHGDYLYFTARNAVNEHEFWRLDTTADTLESLGDFFPGGDDAPWVTTWAETAAGLVFPADDGVHGIELWIDDGDPNGPHLLVDLAPGLTGSAPQQLVEFGDGALFFTGTQFGASNLWATDGTAAGTVQLASNESFVRSAWAIGRDLAFIWAVDVIGQDSLIVTDGTSAGTQTVLSTPFQSSFSTHLTPLGSGNLVAFQNYDPVQGIEAWISDGTVAGTQLVADAYPGIYSTQPHGFSRAGNGVVFAGWTQAYGRELLRLELFDLGGHVAEPYGRGCSGSNGVVPAIGTAGAPSISTAFDITVADAAPNALGLMFYSYQSSNFVLGLGCTVHVPLSIPPNAFLTDASGVAALPVQLDAAFAGRSLFLQALVLDAGGALLGLGSTTSGLELVVGP